MLEFEIANFNLHNLEISFFFLLFFFIYIYAHSGLGFEHAF